MNARIQVYLFRIALTLSLAFLLYSMRSMVPMGADGYYMAGLVESGSWNLFYRSLLTVVLHNIVYTILAPLGFDAWNAIAFSSALAGAIAIQALYAIRHDPLFLAINIFSGCFLVFVGHVENYAWVNMFFILCFLYMRKWFEEEKPLWPGAVFFVLACFSHMLAVFYTPAMVYALWKNRRFNPLETLVPLIVFTITLLTLNFLALAYESFPLLGTDNGLERLVPLFRKTFPNHYFTFFSWDHLKMLLYFHWRSSFLFLALEWPVLFLLRKRINTPYLQFLFISTLCGVAWTTIWHPDWGYNDWDLFGQFAIPLHVLVGCLVCDFMNELSESGYTR